MTQNLKIEVLTGDISIDGMVVTNLVTKEELSTAIVKKADLGADGKIPTSQLPAEIVNTAGIVDEVKLQLETSIKDAVDESNAYAESYADNALSSKADLTSGKVPLEQLPTIDQYPQFGTALSNLSTSILTSVKQRTDELEKTKADLGEDGKVLREQIPSYEKISGLPEQLEVMSTQTAAVSGELDQHKLQTADQIDTLKENIEANVQQLTDRQIYLMRNYTTKELGVDANVGVKPGEYFYVRSANEEEMMVEYQNVGGSAVATGKSYLSSIGVHRQEKAAGTISDALGVSQQKINDGLESIAELRNTNPTRKGLRVYVKSWHEGLALGGGIFVATQKTGLVDNGVTIFASQTPLIFWVRSGIREVTPFMAGAKGDRVQDDQPAFMSALAAGLPVKVEKSTNGYRLAAPVSLTLNQVLEGDRERIKVYIDHDGAAFKLASYGTLKNFEPRAFDVARRFTYDAVVIGESDTSTAYISNTIDNIKPFQCKNSFVLRGGAYWNTFTNIDCFQFRDNGIWLVNDGRGKNNNYFQFKQIASNAQADGQGHYSYNEITWDQTCIRVFGNQNTFIGGEHAPAKIGLWIEGASSGNRFIGMYGEHQKITIRTEAGSENFYDSTCSMGTPEIHPDSIIYGQSGQQNTRYARLGIAPIAAQKQLKALWFFNEGQGAKVLDNSGNGKHLTVVNPVWSDNGRWGRTIELNAARATYINPIPIDILDWTQPFTFAVCVRTTDESRDNPVLTFKTNSPSYSALFSKAGYWAVVDYDGTTVHTTSDNKMIKSPQDNYSWIVIYFDPVNKTLTNLDTERGIGVVTIPNAPRFSPWVTGVSEVNLGFRNATGLDGSLSFVGFWQRRLNMPEVSDLVNMKVPNLYPSGAPMRIDNQPNNTINLQPTATNADIISALNQLATENNELRNKLRDAGMML